MTEDEYMEVSEDYTVLGQLDIRDTRVKESVVAYWCGIVVKSSINPFTGTEGPEQRR